MSSIFNTGLSQNLAFAKPPSVIPQESFWITAPREHFTARCLDAYWDHMRGSHGERLVGGVQWEASVHRDDNRWRAKRVAA